MADFLYPMPSDYYNKGSYHGAATYSSHGVGKLDFATSGVTGEKVRSMTDGEVVKAGPDNSNVGVTSCDVRVTGDYNGAPFIIRYYHIDNFPVSVGDTVKQGDILGYIAETQSGCTGPHLHLDFCNDTDNYSSSPMSGIYSQTAAEAITNTTDYSSEQINCFSYWKSQSGGNDWFGHCWEVIANEATYKTVSVGTTYDSKMDVTKIMKLSDNDWYAIYGMLSYEESGIMDNLDATNDDGEVVNRAICEWVVRCFRNRLLSGSSVEGICQWDSGNPGMSTAIEKGKATSSGVQEFCQAIISGNNYGEVERVAQIYPYPDSREFNEDYFNHLYAACCFAGNLRESMNPLARIPFSGGYFHMEGAFNSTVQTKWKEGFFVSPYI